MKTRLALLTFVFLAGCGGCEPEVLTEVCPKPAPCTIRDDGQVVTGNLRPRGECKLGTSVYVGDCEATCPDYVGPTPEICDYLDNDCDGVADEGFDADKDGFLTCDGDCDDTNRHVFPGQVEACNNIDDNCDGQIDENLIKDCWDGPPDSVFGPPSHCVIGTSSCSAGHWNSCEGQIHPRQFESCNEIDDNCNGMVDEVEPELCGPQDTSGVCAKGDQVCSDGETFCSGAVYPSVEVCDGIDNDCDGVTDENLTQVCQTACGIGEETCNMGQWIGCTALVPTQEICDGIDNDCNGEADEGCSCSLGDAQTCKQDIIDMNTGQPVSCGFGVKVCDAMGDWGPCYFFGTEPELCNAWDDDCDGEIDGISAPCGALTLHMIGECRAGTSSCSQGMWQPCEGEVPPVAEICDGKDNDCDNQIDEDLDPHDKVDILFVFDGSGSMGTKATALEQGISVYVSDFVNTEHRFGLAVYPGRSQTVDVIIPPTDINSFIAALQTFQTNYGGIEPGWDAALVATSPTDSLGLGWRVDTGTVSGAYPYVIMVTDESADQGIANEAQVTANTTNCTVGTCMSGDRWEFYVITPTGFFGQWDDPTFNESARLIDMFPVDAQRYTDVLRGILSNVCR